MTFTVTYIQRALRTSLQVGRPSSAATSETSRMKNLHAEGAPLPLSNWHASSAPSWLARLALCCPLSRGLFLVSSFTAWAQVLHDCAIFGRYLAGPMSQPAFCCTPKRGLFLVSPFTAWAHLVNTQWRHTQITLQASLYWADNEYFHSTAWKGAMGLHGGLAYAVLLSTAIARSLHLVHDHLLLCCWLMFPGRSCL